jgi:hypothetical protein
MIRTLFTVSYTVTVLLGPCVCCCTVQRTVAAEPVISKRAPAPKKSCCSAPSDHGAQPAHESRKDQALSGCPCKHTVVDQIPPSGGSAGGSEVVAQFRGSEYSPFDSVLPPLSSGLPSLLNLIGGLPDPSAVKLSGRDLLSAYQILLC